MKRYVKARIQVSAVKASLQVSLRCPRVAIQRVSLIFASEAIFRSCTGALVQFAARHPQISVGSLVATHGNAKQHAVYSGRVMSEVRVGHDDWRHWLRSEHRICNAFYEHWLGDRTEAWVLSGIKETTSPRNEPNHEPAVALSFNVWHQA